MLLIMFVDNLGDLFGLAFFEKEAADVGAFFAAEEEAGDADD